MRTNGNWYCYFPMPYWESATIRIHNGSADPISNLDAQVATHESAYDKALAGYFCARRRSASYPKVSDDLVLFEESGVAGKFVGISLYMEGDGGGGGGMVYLEGDARIYIDGSMHPFIHGTGNEDWFNAAFYYNDYSDKGANQAAELFSMPFHGLPAKYHYHAADNWTQAYRFNISDPIGWTSSMLFTMEHGGYPVFDSGYYSVVGYSYQQREPSTYVAAEVSRDTANNHYYSCDGVLSTNTAKFITPNAELAAEDVLYRGYSNVLTSTFSASIPPDNDGVIIQSLSDFSAGTNTATVRVGGRVVGSWSQMDLGYTNSPFGWGVTEVVLPASVTKGVRRLDVEISYSVPSTEYGFRVLPIAGRPHMDSYYRSWVENYIGLRCFTNMTDDLDGDGLDNLAEYAVGGSPVSGENAGFSFSPEVITAGPTNYLKYVYAKRKDSGPRGLVYSIEQADDLLLGSWSQVDVDPTGVGVLDAEFDSVTNHIPIGDVRQEFFRLRVEHL